MKMLRSVVVVLLTMLAVPAYAATTLVSPVQTFTQTSHQWLNSLSATGAFSASQPAVGDLSAVNGGTVLGNPTGSSAAPTATATPVLGIGGTTAGTLGLANNNTSGAVVTVTNPAATTAYNFNLPATAGSSGQVLESGAGGTNAMTWATLNTSPDYTVTAKTTGYTTSNTDSGVVFNNTGASGSVAITAPTTPTVGEHHCLTVDAAQNFQFTAGTGQTISLGGAVGASAGNIQSSQVGAIVCLYADSTTSWIAQNMTGQWTLN